MIDHLSTYARDYPLTKAFYVSIFEPLEVTLHAEIVTEWDTTFPTRRCCAFGSAGKTTFWVIEVLEAASPRHVAFSAQNHAKVDAFYRTAMRCGGKSNGAPGFRPEYHADYYAAFVIDPDGNNIEAVCHQDISKPLQKP